MQIEKKKKDNSKKGDKRKKNKSIHLHYLFCPPLMNVAGDL
jgi:hypothetical protein